MRDLTQVVVIAPMVADGQASNLDEEHRWALRAPAEITALSWPATVRQRFDRLGLELWVFDRRVAL
jgi:hypothetical protein